MQRRLKRRTLHKKQKSIPKKKIIFLIIGILAAFIVIKAIVLGISYGPLLYQLIFNRGVSLSQTNGRVNILLLGIGGGKHDGPDLTDTIIFASLDQKANRVTLLSIPRDLWVPEMHGKINTAYAVGESKMSGGGLVLAKAMIEKLTNQQINYGVRIDFTGFVKAVDMVDGLDINVANTFDDYQYPISGKEVDVCGHSQAEVDALATDSAQQEAFPCRYKHLHFNKGIQHMDGQTTLEYVRSRHADGIEGSDFARSRREEIVIAAFKNKVFSAGTLLNPAKILSLYTILKSSIDTDIPQDKFDDFFRLAQEMKHAKINSYVLDEGDLNANRPGLLKNPTNDPKQFDFQWVVIPRMGNGNYLEIQSYLTCVQVKSNCVVSSASPQ